jgi:hypothetical protein
VQPSFSRLGFSWAFPKLLIAFESIIIVRFPSVYGLMFHAPSIDFILEIIFVHAQFLICGVLIIVSISSIVTTLERVSAAAGQSTSSNSTVKAIERRIMRLGFACAVSLVFNVVNNPPSSSSSSLPPFSPDKRNPKS